MREKPSDVAIKRQLIERISAELMATELSAANQIADLVPAFASKYPAVKQTLRLIPSREVGA